MFVILAIAGVVLMGMVENIQLYKMNHSHVKNTEYCCRVICCERVDVVDPIDTVQERKVEESNFKHKLEEKTELHTEKEIKCY